MENVSEVAVPKQQKQKPVEDDDDLPRDPAERKRVLNVLAQRRYRRRKKEQQAQLEGFIQALNGSQAVKSPRIGLNTFSSPKSAANSIPGRILEAEEDVSNLSDTTASTGTASWPNSLSSTRSPSAGLNDFSPPSSHGGSNISDSEIDSLLNLPPTDNCTTPNDQSGTYLDPTVQRQIGWATELQQDANQDFAFQLSSFLQNEDVQNSTFADDFLVSVPELDLLRAARTIAMRLNSAERIFGANANSIFFEAPDSFDWSLLPSNLQPTAAQLTIPHHPVLDLLPWPKVRSRLITLFNIPAEEWPKHPQDGTVMTPFRLVCDMEDGGIRVYGDDPTTESSWEVQQNFFDAWWWALDHNVIFMSNQRKKAKGGTPLRMGFVET